MHTLKRPNPNHAPGYAKRYFDYSGDQVDLLEALKESKDTLIEFFKAIPSEKENHRYAPEKWTIKGVLAHIIDTERIFCGRAIIAARHDEVNSPGYDDDAYAKYNNEENRSLTQMIEEFELMRRNTICLFSTFEDEHLDFVGQASKAPITARSCAWLMVGHGMHHMAVIRDKYLY